MTITVRRTWIRPNVNIEFYKFPEEIQSYVNTTYVLTGKRLDFNWSQSKDTLTSIVVTTWEKLEYLQEFLADDRIRESAKLIHNYNITNNIFESIDN
jgi:hypothetical protein